MSKSAAHRVPPYKRPIIVGGFLLIAVAVGLVTVLIFKNINNQTTDSTPDGGNSSTGSSISSPQKDNNTDKPENKAPQYEGESPNELSELTGVFTYNEVDTETQVLHAAVMINQYLLNGDGQCIYRLKQGVTIIKTDSSPAEPSATTTMCGPFSLSVANLSPGIYQTEVEMTGDGKTGIITEEIEIK